jgi:hypothetical protein
MLFDRITLSLHVSLSVFLQKKSLCLLKIARARALTPLSAQLVYSHYKNEARDAGEMENG